MHGFPYPLQTSLCRLVPPLSLLPSQPLSVGNSRLISEPAPKTIEALSPSVRLHTRSFLRHALFLYLIWLKSSQPGVHDALLHICRPFYLCHTPYRFMLRNQQMPLINLITCQIQRISNLTFGRVDLLLATLLQWCTFVCHSHIITVMVLAATAR